MKLASRSQAATAQAKNEHIVRSAENLQYFPHATHLIVDQGSSAALNLFVTETASNLEPGSSTELTVKIPVTMWISRLLSVGQDQYGILARSNGPGDFSDMAKFW